MRQYNPLISIIIPAYNSEDYITECIESALNQTYNNIEIIVIDDGSTDKTLATIQIYKNIIVIAQTNQGASCARNIGLKKARGKYIQFLDSDDILDSNKIATQVNALRYSTSKTLIFGNWVKFKNDVSGQPIVNRCINRDYLIPPQLLADMWGSSEMIQPGAWLVSSDLIECVGLWDEKLSLNDDGEYFCRIILASDEIKFVSNSLCFYRTAVPRSLSKNINFKAAKSQLLSVIKCITHSAHYNSIYELKRPLAKLLRTFIYEYENIYPMLSAEARKELFQLEVSPLPLVGGRRFRFITKILGFEAALKVKNILNS